MNKGSLKYTENNSMVLVNLYPWIITVIVNGLNLSIKNHRVTERTKKKKDPANMLPTRGSFQRKGHTNSPSEEMEKYIPYKWKPKSSKYI